MTFRPRPPRNQNLDKGFAIVEALVAAGVSAVVLTSSIAILNRQIAFASNGRAMVEARSIINQDIRTLRHYASLWSMENNIFVEANLAGQEFPDAMVYISSPACRAFSRRGGLESFARSDMPTTYSMWFPYMPPIWRNNAVLSSIPVNRTTVYELRRRYTIPTITSGSQVGTSSAPSEDETPFTLRLTYTLRSVQNNPDGSVSRTDLPIEQTADINLVAQYSC